MKFLDRFKRKNPSETPTLQEETKAPSDISAASEGAPESQKEPLDPDELRLELGDFLHRIPGHLLHPGPHDLKYDLSFSIEEMTKRKGRGETINLIEIYRQAPHIFRGEVKESENYQIRFPWQKLAEVADASRSGAAQAASPSPATENLAEKSRQKETPAADQLPKPSQPSPAPSFANSVEDEAKPALKETAKPVAESSREEVPADTERRIATIKSEYQRQLAELEAARKSHAAEIDRLQGELSSATTKLDAEKNAAAARRDQLKRSTQERDATQQQLAELQQQLEQFQKDTRVSALTAERDALLQQKAHLTSQIAEISKRGVSPTLRSSEGAGPSANHQRQIEDLQRRITLMEASQRDTALQLAREKEARAKAEKLLAAADKLQEQSANYMETAKAEMRREIETSMKARELEARKTQKELQDQLASVNEQYRKALADLDDARVQLTQAEHTRSTTADPIQAQTVKQLEDDIESYRDRLKVLLRERDAAREEARRLASAATTAAPHDELLSAEREKLESQLATLRSEHAAQLAVLERTHAHKDDSLEQRLKEALHERDALKAQCVALESSSERHTAAHAERLSKLEKDHAALLQDKQDIAHRLAESERTRRALEKEREKLTASGVGFLGDPSLHAELDSARAQLDQLQHLYDEAKSQRGANADPQSNEENARLTAERQGAFAQLDAEKMAREQLEKEAASLRVELASATDRLQSAAASTVEKDELAARLGSLEKMHAEEKDAYMRERDQLRAEKDTFAAELHNARKQHQNALASFEQEREQMRATQTDTQALRNRISELEIQLVAQRDEGSVAIAEHRQRSNEETARLQQELLLLQSELEALVHQRDELLRRLARFTEEQKRHAEGRATEPRVVPMRPVAEEPAPTNVIEVPMPEIIPPESAGGIHIPHIRPVSVPPPKIGTL